MTRYPLRTRLHHAAWHLGCAARHVWAAVLTIFNRRKF
jgi:hypothetical protein